MPALGTTRTSSVGADDTTVALTFSLVSADIPAGALSFGQITIDISSNITNSKYVPTAYSYSQQNQSTLTYNQIATVTFTKNSQNITMLVPASHSNLSYSNLVTITGKNTLEVPIDIERYSIVIQNASHILYANYNVIFPNKLVPISQGLTLTRLSTRVG